MFLIKLIITPVVQSFDHREKFYRELGEFIFYVLPAYRNFTGQNKVKIRAKKEEDIDFEGGFSHKASSVYYNEDEERGSPNKLRKQQTSTQMLLNTITDLTSYY